MTPGAVAAALGGAGCLGLATFLEHRAAQDLQAAPPTGLRLLLRVARRRTWWAGIALETASVPLQYVALHHASVASVQALLVLALPVAVALTGLVARAWLPLVVTTAALVTLALTQGDVRVQPVSGVGAVAVPLLVALLAAVAGARASTAWRGVWAGVVTGCTAALLAVAASHPASELLGQPATYATALAGLLTLQAGQAAITTAVPAAALAGLALAEPMTAVALAAAELHQRPALGAGPVAAALVAGWGVVRLARLSRGPQEAPLTQEVPCPPC